MDKVSLTITADPATIARVLSVLDPNVHTSESRAPNDLSTSIGAGTPVAPVSPPSVPNLGVVTPPAPFPTTPPILTSAPDDDDGPAPANAPAVDKAGMPWDERIHTKNKATKADGTWKRGKGLDDGFVAAVEAELRGRMQPVPLAAPTPPPVVPAPAPIIAPPPVHPVPAPAPVVAPQPAPAPVAAPVPAPASAEVNDFASFMTHLGTLSQSGRVDPTYLVDLTARVAAAWSRPLGAITDLGANPDMIPYVVQTMQNESRW